MQNNSKTIGENKLESLLRLMKRYEDQVKGDTTDSADINVVLNANGYGTLKCYNQSVYDFEATENLIEYLEAGQLKRTLMVRG